MPNGSFNVFDSAFPVMPDRVSANTDGSTLRTPWGQMVYTDKGDGAPVVFLHGNPTSGFLFRHVIDHLVPEYRCIAPDYLGFGRSDAPSSFSYRPPAQTTLITALLNRLELSDVTLVLHDWGGPIGLSYALRRPEAIRGLVLMNTWGWALHRRPLVRLFARLVGSRFGRHAVEDWNAFARLVMPATLARPRLPGPPWIRTYATALDSRTRRHACWTLAKSLLAETPWLRTLWSHRRRLIQKPALLCWGMADPAFGRERTLQRWQGLFRNAQMHRHPDIGHYLPEELGTALGPLVRTFLRETEP